MRSTYKVFRSREGVEDVCFRANEFVSRLGPDRVLNVTCFAEASTNQGGALSLPELDNEFVAVVWYWDGEPAKGPV
jgi:hypothetical protein